MLPVARVQARRAGSLLKDLTRRVGQLRAALLRTGGVEAVVTQHELEIAALLLPEQSAVLGRGDHQPGPLRAGEEEVVVVALDVGGRGVAGDIVLRPAVGADRLEQFAIVVLPDHVARLGIEAAEELARDCRSRSGRPSCRRRGCRGIPSSR